jgi:N-acetylglucosaminyldiphosphoundecaprenol N-acetyl-beta-D-mannosaminyltransferase
MSTPRQDYVAQSLASSSGTIVIAVGAAFDFVSGAKPAAPEWMTRGGIEWVFRLASEPGRLWKRYLVGGFLFGRRVFRFRNIDLPNRKNL